MRIGTATHLYSAAYGDMAASTHGASARESIRAEVGTGVSPT